MSEAEDSRATYPLLRRSEGRYSEAPGVGTETGQWSRLEDATRLCARKGPADDSGLRETTAIEPTRPCGADTD